MIGLASAVGIDLQTVYAEIASALAPYGYECHDLHLTDQLSSLDWDVETAESPADERYASFMDAGNRLREAWDRDDAFGLLAVSAITLARLEATGSDELPADRHAYVVRSLKRKEEAELLRSVYGDRFIQLSIYEPRDLRQARLTDKIKKSRVPPHASTPAFTAEDLIARDESEPGDHGQGLRGVFHSGDVFIDARHITANLERAVALLFGDPTITPTKDELGMFHASAAALRSAELGRQVGAAICTHEGSIVATGTNEVPKAHGGMYWEGDPGDAREFTRGHDTNDVKKAELAETVADLITDELDLDSEQRERLLERLGNSRLDDLIEFVRAVHAEMAAITDAARRGVSIAGTTLYATTFPCHHCARHIVASGIMRVVYVEPYPKSLAAELHDDALVVDPATDVSDRVQLVPFVGVGPRRFLTLFTMPARKDKATGKVLEPERTIAMPRISLEAPEFVGEMLPYFKREERALQLLIDVQETKGPAFVDD